MNELSKESIKIDSREYVDPVKEVINGKTYIIVNTSFIHSHIVTSLRDIFFLYFYNKGNTQCRVFSEGLNIYLDKEDEDTYVIPDVAIICGDIKIQGNGYIGVPELIVEVLSDKTRTKDKGLKFRLYEKTGVKEYFIVDPRSKTIEQYILKDGSYFLEPVIIIDLDEVENDNENFIMESKVFEGMKVDFNNIFKV
ncbi:MAG: Uma2 family endonuclease [Oscillospiraceae bacterium]|nr:Uma2 family endonuclease [Oscillospiraceae bacterium]